MFPVLYDHRFVRFATLASPRIVSFPLFRSSRRSKCARVQSSTCPAAFGPAAGACRAGATEALAAGLAESASTTTPCSRATERGVPKPSQVRDVSLMDTIHVGIERSQS